MSAQIIRRRYTHLPNSDLEQISLINSQGNQVNICNMGINVTDIFINNAQGQRLNVILGNTAFDPENKTDLSPPSSCMNTLVGRYANRISLGRFTTDNGEFQLPCNLGEHHLHGGDNGLDKQIWQITQAEVIDQVPTLTLQFTSPDGADGYPGEVQFSVQIRFNQDNNLSFDMQATTDQDTYINLTHHGYFNLAGSHAGNMLDHEFKIYSTEVSTADALNIPNGQFTCVANSELDFSEFRLLTDALNSQHDYMHNFLGIDHNYVFKKQNDSRLIKQAEVQHTASGLKMTVLSDLPAMQLYSGQHIKGENNRLGGQYDRYAGFCLEPQHFPDSPNRPEFPSTLVTPSQPYHYCFQWQFDLIDA